MQHQVASRTRRWHRSGLLRLTGTNRFAKGQQCARQIKVYRFLGQHGEAVKDVSGGLMPGRFGQIVINHGWQNLYGLSHPSVR